MNQQKCRTVTIRALSIIMAFVFTLLMLPIHAEAISPCGGTGQISTKDCESIMRGSPWAKPEATTGSVCAGPALPAISDDAALADALNKYIQTNGGKGAPFDGLGADIVAGAKRSGVNPLLIVAIARKESSYGLHIPPDSFNSFGRTAASGQPSISFAERNWYRWGSWVLSVNDPAGSDEADLIKKVYLDAGLTTIDQVINKYAPPVENNTSVYVTQVTQWMNEMVTAAGSALTCGTTSGNSPVTGIGSAPTNPKGAVALGQQMAAAQGWTGDQWVCLYKLWMRESSWNYKATNPSSGAYGIPQSLPASKLASAGSDWKTNPATQIKWGLGYIKERYKTPCGAWAHSESTGWY